MICIAITNLMYNLNISIVNDKKYRYSDTYKNCRNKGITDVSNALGDKIRRLRKEKKLTLDELAKQTDSSKGYIWELENRDTRKPSAEKLMKIADVLDVTTEFLLNENRLEPDTNEMQAALYRNFEKLEPEDKERVMRMVKDWSKN